MSRRMISSAFGAIVFALGALPLTAVQATTPRVVTADYQPDAMIKLSTDATYVGGNIYNAVGTDEYRSIVLNPGETGTFVVKIQNDGNVDDAFRLKGNGSNANFKVRFLNGATGTTDITASILAGTYYTRSLAPGSSVKIRVVVTVKPDGRPTSSILAWVRAVSKNSPTPKVDRDRVLPDVTVNWLTASAPGDELIKG